MCAGVAEPGVEPDRRRPLACSQACDGGATHTGGGWIDWINSTSTDTNSDYDGRIRFRQSTGFEFDLKIDSSYTRIFKFLNGDLLVGDGTDNQINHLQ